MYKTVKPEEFSNMIKIKKLYHIKNTLDNLRRNAENDTTLWIIAPNPLSNIK